MDFGGLFETIGNTVNQAAPVVQQGLELSKKIKLLLAKKGQQVTVLPPSVPVTQPIAFQQRERRSLFANPIVLLGGGALIFFMMRRR